MVWLSCITELNSKAMKSFAFKKKKFDPQGSVVFWVNGIFIVPFCTPLIIQDRFNESVTVLLKRNRNSENMQDIVPFLYHNIGMIWFGGSQDIEITLSRITGIGKKSRSIFLELDANAKNLPPTSPTPQEPPKRKEIVSTACPTYSKNHHSPDVTQRLGILRSS